jgi:hypothetical protein
MKHASHAVFAVFVTLSAFAQSSPVIATLTPDRGPASGGTEVTITGSNFLPAVQCIVPCPATVTFGDVTVPVKSESDARLVVVTPSHSGGTVDVTVNVAGRDSRTVQKAFTFDEGIEAGYEQVLLPVYLDGTVPGANGTQWKTDLWIRNNGTEAATLAPWPCPPNQVCPPVIPLTATLNAGLSLHNLPPFFQTPDANTSRLLWVREPNDVSFSLRFADVSRSSLNGGTDMPVIREKELLRRPAQLFNVPLNAQFRVLLRVFDVAYSSSKFRVTVYAQTEGETAPLHSAEVTATTVQTGEFKSEAAYAQFDVTDLLRMERTWPEAVRIQIDPLTAGSRYWGFASVTNNETQLVTLVTPQ